MGKHEETRQKKIEVFAQKTNWRFQGTFKKKDKFYTTWLCTKDHPVTKRIDLLAEDFGCAECSGKAKGSIEKCKAFAQTLGGDCLSTEYQMNKSDLTWICKRKHTWDASAAEVMNVKVWCQECRKIEHREEMLKKMKEHAKSRNGKCLSRKYINAQSYLKWKCADGHTWESIPINVYYHNHWCPHCRVYYNEEKCRFVLEAIFNKLFKKCLKAIAPYELDGYNNELSLAFEFHGKQHYEFNPYFHTSVSNFESFLEKDTLKEKLAKEKNIQLIIIPFNAFKTDKELVEFISKRAGLSKAPKVDFTTFYQEHSKLEEMKELAQSNNGHCLSNEYVHSQAHLAWKCHEQTHPPFLLTPHHVKHSGSWCPTCAGRVPNVPENAQALMNHYFKNEVLS